MGAARPVLLIIAVGVLVVTGAALLGSDQPAPAQIIMGTVIYVILAGVSIVLVNRVELRNNQQRAAESRLLDFFKRWLVRVEEREFEYINIRHSPEHESQEAYLEDYTWEQLVDLREALPEGHQLSEYGVIRPPDGKEFQLDTVLFTLKSLGWDEYFLEGSSPGHIFDSYHLKREIGEDDSNG